MFFQHSSLYLSFHSLRNQDRNIIKNCVYYMFLVMLPTRNYPWAWHEVQVIPGKVLESGQTKYRGDYKAHTISI